MKSKRVAAAAAVLVAALFVRGLTIDLEATPEQPNLRVFRGAMHVHSSASHDATQSIAEIARDAKKAGLDFVVLNDHGAAAGAPQNVDGVLIVPEAEASLAAGHALVLGAPAAAREVVAKPESAGALAATGAIVGAAHPDSAKNPLADADVLTMHAYEALSASSDFYALIKSPRALFLAFYPLRPTLTLSALYHPHALSLARYDRLSRTRPLALWCGADDHGRVATAERLRVYTTYLPTFMPTGDLEDDARELRTQLARGALFCALGLYGDASPLSVTVRSIEGLQTLGDEASAPATLKVRWQGPLPAGHRVVLYRDGERVAEGEGALFERTLDAPGRYRVEVEREVPGFWFFRRRLTWIYANPITVRPASA